MRKCLMPFILCLIFVPLPGWGAGGENLVVSIDSLTPASGTTPVDATLTVSATTTVGSLVGYALYFEGGEGSNFGDVHVFGPLSGATATISATHTYLSGGTWTVTAVFWNEVEQQHAQTTFIAVSPTPTPTPTPTHTPTPTATPTPTPTPGAVEISISLTPTSGEYPLSATMVWQATSTAPGATGGWLRIQWELPVNEAYDAFTWTALGGNVFGASGTTAHTYAAIGAYAVRFSAYDTWTTATEEAEIEVTIQADVERSFWETSGGRWSIDPWDQDLRFCPGGPFAYGVLVHNGTGAAAYLPETPEAVMTILVGAAIADTRVCDVSPVELGRYLVTLAKIPSQIAGYPRYGPGAIIEVTMSGVLDGIMRRKTIYSNRLVHPDQVLR